MGQWEIGGNIKLLREEQGISIEQLCEGLCSAATLSRIEAGERTAGMMLAQRLLERLGYQPNGYEIYCGNEEFEQHEKRQELLVLKKEKKYARLREKLEQYKAEAGLSGDVLQEQFMKMLYGELAVAEGDMKKGMALTEKAISLTVPGWKEKEFAALMLGAGELELFSFLGDIYEKLGEQEKAYYIWNDIWRYLKRKNTKKENMGAFHISLICRMAAYLENTGESLATVELCDEGLEILALTTRIYDWDRLLYLKGKGMEGLYRKGMADRQEVIEVYKRAYTAARLFEKKKQAEQIRSYLKEEYGWEFTR